MIERLSYPCVIIDRLLTVARSGRRDLRKCEVAGSRSRRDPHRTALVNGAAAGWEKGKPLMLRIGFDVGGVISKYPETFRNLLFALGRADSIEVWIISDMHPEQTIVDMLERNDISFSKQRVRSADYRTHGEMCKAVLCEQLGIDILIDDFPGYVAAGEHVRLLLMPSPTEPYYADSWKTDGSEGDFGRRKRPKNVQ